MIKIDKELALLQKINKVEAPAILFSKINMRIELSAVNVAPLQWKLIFSAAAILIVLLNISVFMRKEKTNKITEFEQVIGNMQLSSSNDLYHE